MSLFEDDVKNLWQLMQLIQYLEILIKKWAAFHVNFQERCDYTHSELRTGEPEIFGLIFHLPPKQIMRLFQLVLHMIVFEKHYL